MIKIKYKIEIYFMIHEVWDCLDRMSEETLEEVQEYLQEVKDNLETQVPLPVTDGKLEDILNYEVAAEEEE